MNGTTKVAEGTATLTVTGTPTVYFGVGSDSTPRTSLPLSGAGSEATLCVYVNGQTGQYLGYNYNWQVVSGSSVNVLTGAAINNYSQTIRGITAGTTRIRVTVTQNNATIGYADIDVTVGNSNLLVSATISGSSDYMLSSLDDKGYTSVYDQIYNAVSNTAVGRRLHSVTFLTTTSVYGDLENATAYNATYYADNVTTSGARLSQLVFSPKQVGTARFSFYAYYTDNFSSVTANNYITGTLEITVTNTVSTGDIIYTGELGKDVYFELRDFENFYYDKTRGTLSYVTFTLPSGGTLYADGGRLSTGNSCYASPSRTQTDLAGVYFSPTGTTATRPSTVRISFTAYGTNSSYSNNRTGTVVINYLSGTAKDITYNAASTSGVSLRTSDFTEAYRQAVGSTAPSGLTIQFQDVPSYGTLTYKDSSRTNSSEVALRSSNIKNYKFTTRSSGSNQLSDVTYTPSGSRTDTISYIAYNGNTPQFTGKVVFNATMVAANMSVTFTGGQTITLNYNEFVKANATAIASTATLRIMSAPVSGTLSYAGTAVTAGVTSLAPTAVGSLTYRANSGFNGTDKVIFSCVDASGNTVATGQINLIVSGNTTGGGVSNISQFTDVPSNAWYASDLNTLISRGIMQGKGAGKFDPKGELKYGEALKIFLLSAGYSAQEGTGKDWAQGYKTLAVSNGWISSDIDLDARISRNAMAELAARVLGISSNSAVPPAWTDGTSNGYANALYYTNPQILVGNADGTFKGNDTLQRQEICKIASRVLNYKSNVQSTDRPSWLG